MPNSTFIYAIYIRSTPEKVWNALTTPVQWDQCWMGTHLESDWKVGSPWRAVSPAGAVYDSGAVLESLPAERLTLRWRNEWQPEFAAEGDSLCNYEIAAMGDTVRFTITHSMERPDSKLIASVSGAWPLVGSNLKSLLETGDVALTQNPRHVDH